MKSLGQVRESKADARDRVRFTFEESCSVQVGSSTFGIHRIEPCSSGNQTPLG